VSIPTGPGAFADRLIEFIATDVAMADEPIEPDTDLLLTGLVDSLGVVLIVNWIEDDLGISIDPGDVVLENFQTVRQMVAYAETAVAVT
jgi:acyl carrier protein